MYENSCVKLQNLDKDDNVGRLQDLLDGEEHKSDTNDEDNQPPQERKKKPPKYGVQFVIVGDEHTDIYFSFML